MIASGQSRKLAMQRPSEDRVLSSATDDGGEEEVDLFVLTYNCGGFSHANRWRDDESMAGGALGYVEAASFIRAGRASVVEYSANGTMATN